MVKEQFQEAVSQLSNLEQARSEPYVLDDYTVDRVRQFFGEEQGFVAISAEQVARWRQEHPTPSLQKDLDNLAGQIEQWGRVVADILALGEELSKGTIDKVMAKSDLELGLEAMARGSNAPPLTSEQHAVAKLISDKYTALARAGRNNAELLVEMKDMMPDFHQLIKTVDAFSMDELSVRYEGFYQYAKLLESLAAGIRSGEIEVPK
jgi:hypothetical protein